MRPTLYQLSQGSLKTSSVAPTSSTWSIAAHTEPNVRNLLAARFFNITPSERKMRMSYCIKAVHDIALQDHLWAPAQPSAIKKPNHKSITTSTRKEKKSKSEGISELVQKLEYNAAPFVTVVEQHAAHLGTIEFKTEFEFWGKRVSKLT
jgi:hypothetical protein